MTDQVIAAHDVESYLVQRTDDDTRMAVVLKVHAGAVGFAFSNELFGKFAAKLFETTTAALADPASADEAQTIVLPVQDISFDADAGQSPAVTVTGQAGRLRLALKLDVETLVRSFKRFLDLNYPAPAGDPPQTEAISPAISAAPWPRDYWDEAREVSFEDFTGGIGRQWAAGKVA